MTGGRSWPLLLAASALLIAASMRVWTTGEGDTLAAILLNMGCLVLGAWLFSEARSS